MGLASGANLTFESRLPPSLRSNVKFKSSPRIIKLLVVLINPTFARVRAAGGCKCRIGTTSRLIACALAASLLFLGGCASEVSPLSPALPGSALAGSTVDPAQRATVVLAATIDGLQCAEGRIVLARAVGAGFERVTDVSVPTSYAGRSPVGIVLLAPGAYHIVSYACRNGANVTYLGTGGPEGQIPWTAATYDHSLATFTAGRGETLIAGGLRIKRQPGSGSLLDPADRAIGLLAEGLSPAELATLAAANPDLTGDLVARSLVLSPGADKGNRLAKCALVVDGAEPEAKPTKRKAKGNAAAFTALSGPVVPANACRKGKGLGPALDKLVEQVN